MKCFGLVLTVVVASAACGGSSGVGETTPDEPSPDDPTGSDAGTSTEAGQSASDAGGNAFDIPSIPYTVPEGAPIAAPDRAWTYVPVPEAHCANGSATGIAVNMNRSSRRVLVAIAGGGACWEAAACAGGLAVHLQDTVGETTVLQEAQASALGVLFDRNDPQNDFKDASFVYIPYCTGDLHAGTRTHDYGAFSLAHVGAKNMDAYLGRLRPSFPNAERVVVTGFSAGGYGATFHWWRFQKALPWARVDLVDDSGIMVTPVGGRYGTMQNVWGIAFPPGCTNCATELPRVLSYSTTLLPAPRRAAHLAYRQDAVIAAYFGLSGQDIETGISAVRSGAAPSLKTFEVNGAAHVVLATPNVATSGGVSIRAWLHGFATDASSWDHAGP